MHSSSGWRRRLRPRPIFALLDGCRNTGVFTELGGTALFPELTPAYAAYHHFNCKSGAGSDGFSTYHVPGDVVASYGAGNGKANDQNTLNCVRRGTISTATSSSRCSLRTAPRSRGATSASVMAASRTTFCR